MLFYTPMVEGEELIKRYDQTLTIPCMGCSDSPMCSWSINGSPVPDSWVQNDGDLTLPAYNWNVLGNVNLRCGTFFQSYNILSSGMWILCVAMWCPI